MNLEKFTQKSLEALQLAQSLAAEHNNTQIEECHLLYAVALVQKYSEKWVLM